MDVFLETLRRLRVDKSKGIAKPYKPSLLAAVVLLIGKGKLRSADIALDGGLTSAFKQLLAMLYPNWNRLGTQILPKLRTGSDLKIGLEFSVTVSSDGAVGLANDLRQVLQELGLADALDGRMRLQ